MTLQKKMAIGTFWSLVEKGGQQLVSFVIFIVVARIVGPEEYGLAMLCFVILTFSQMLLLGLSDGIVSLQIKDEMKLSQLFWTITILGGMLSVLCFVYAEFIANVFNSSHIIHLLQLFSPVPFLVGLTAVPHMIIMQKMDFKVYAIRSLVATTGSGIVGVLLAFYGYGATSIIIQQIVLYILTNIILWAFVDWRPTIVINTEGIKITLSPGINMLCSNSLTFIEQQLPRIFIGRFLGALNVGYFSFAFRMRFALQEILIAPALITLFPVLSQIKTKKDQQDEILENIFFLIGLIVLPIVMLAVLTAPMYVPLLFGDKWLDAIPLLQILISLGAVAPFLIISNAIFRAFNKVNLLLRLQIIIITFFIGLVYIASHFSLLAIGVVIFVFSVLRIPVYFFIIKKYTGLNVGVYVKSLINSIISTVVMGGTVYIYMNSLAGYFNFWDFIVVLFIGLSVYFIVSILLQKSRILTSIKKIKGMLAKV